MVQPKAPTLKRSFSWSFSGNAVYVAAQWGMVMVLARMGTPEMVGQFALGLAVTTPVIMFTNLQLRAVQATDAEQRYRFSDYLALRLIATMLALIVILGVVYALDYRGETGLVILIVALAKAFESISDAFYGLFLQHERQDHMAKSMMIKGPLSLVTFSLGVLFTGSVVGGAIGLVIAWALLLLGYDVRSGATVLKSSPWVPTGSIQSTSLQPRWQSNTLLSLAWLALPLGLVMMLISLNTNIPRYFLEGYLGEKELGIFAAMAYVVIAGEKLVDSVRNAAIPRLARYHAARNEVQFRTLVLKLVGVGTLVGVAGVLAATIIGQEILALLYGEEYAEHADVFLWLMIAGGINYVAGFLGSGITAARRFRIQLPLFVLENCCCAAACFWLVPISGLRGAAIALVVAAAVLLCGCIAVVGHVIHTLRE